ncbi:hypothetical protein CLOP_g9415 [Closterium sp. NIES-67]|nr:hypothetical protein CLOP_g9415 [Closterium sp. NIES-67]
MNLFRIAGSAAAWGGGAAAPPERAQDTSSSAPTAASASPASATPPVPVARWAEIQFSDEDNDERELQVIWREYKAAGMQDSFRFLGIFLESFIRIYEDWKPEPPQRDKSSSSKGGDGGRMRLGFRGGGGGGGEGGAGARGTIVGCSQGHPTAVIQQMVFEIKNTIPAILEMESEDLSDRAFVLNLLCALTIALRSAHNRRVFAFHDGYAALTILFKDIVAQFKTVQGMATAGRQRQSLPTSPDSSSPSSPTLPPQTPSSPLSTPLLLLPPTPPLGGGGRRNLRPA